MELTLQTTDLVIGTDPLRRLSFGSNAKVHPNSAETAIFAISSAKMRLIGTKARVICVFPRNEAHFGTRAIPKRENRQNEVRFGT